jgi:hypothetical protein
METQKRIPEPTKRILETKGLFSATTKAITTEGRCAEGNLYNPTTAEAWYIFCTCMRAGASSTCTWSARIPDGTANCATPPRMVELGSFSLAITVNALEDVPLRLLRTRTCERDCETQGNPATSTTERGLCDGAQVYFKPRRGYSSSVADLKRQLQSNENAQPAIRPGAAVILPSAS